MAQTNPPPRRTRNQGTVSKTVETKQGGEVVRSRGHTEYIDVPEDVGEHPGYVMIKGGVTKQMAPYESINVQVSIGMPCVATIQAAKKKYEEIAIAVDELVANELKVAMHGEEAAANV